MRLSILKFTEYLVLVISICLNIEYFMTSMYLDCPNRIRTKRVDNFLDIDYEELEKTLQSHLTDMVDLKLTLPKEHSNIVDEHFRKVQKFVQTIASRKSNMYTQTVLINKKKMADVYNGGVNVEPLTVSEKNVSREKMSKNLVYTCDEQFLGTLYGYPLYRAGFARKQCQKADHVTATSLILDRPDIEGGVGNETPLKLLNKTISHVVNRYKYVYVIVHARTKIGSEIIQTLQNVEIYYFNKSDEVSEILNQILKSISTRFTVIAPCVTLINSQFDFKRMLNVYEKSNAHIVASSVKDFYTGDWEPGCYQTSMKLYHLRYWPGYQMSQYSCQYCDFAIGAFLASSDFLQKVPFRKQAGESLLYEDYFLSLSSNTNFSKPLILVCPDSMVYRKKRLMHTADFETFAKLRDLSFIDHYSKQNLTFPCPRNHMKLIKKCRVGKGLAVPPCCLDLLHEGLKLLVEILERNNISSMLLEGSVLGAVKFQGFLLWEKDADIAISSKDFYKLQSLKSSIKQNGYDLVIDEEAKNTSNSSHGGVAHVRIFPWSVQIFGLDTLDSYEGARTKIRLKDYHVYLPENPGRYARNRYGHEIYKHAEHWMTAKRSSGWVEYKSGKFETCSIPHHHSCLDQFKADGCLEI